LSQSKDGFLGGSEQDEKSSLCNRGEHHSW